MYHRRAARTASELPVRPLRTQSVDEHAHCAIETLTDRLLESRLSPRAEEESTGQMHRPPPETEMSQDEEVPEARMLVPADGEAALLETQPDVLEDDDWVEAAPQEPESETAAGMERPTSRSEWPLIRSVEVILGILALGMGILAYYYRRR